MRQVSLSLCVAGVLLAIPAAGQAAGVDLHVGGGRVNLWVAWSGRAVGYESAPIVQGPLIPTPEPTPHPAFVETAPPQIMPDPIPAPTSYPLFARVKYEDREDVHPRAVSVVVAVPDPTFKPGSCDTCEPPVVFVEICVPPNCEPEIEVKKDGREIKYDFGEYKVKLKAKRGCIEVEYED